MKPEEYGEDYRAHLLEQYKLYVEMADRVSQRRDQSNRFYVTIVSALAAIVVVIARFGLPVGGASGALSGCRLPGNRIVRVRAVGRMVAEHPLIPRFE